MYKHQLNIRVRYAETDKMGYVYYGNYATFLEMGRVESLRNLGISYRKLEDNHIIMPVLELYQKFFKPAFYDDLLTLETRIEEMPTVRVRFDYTFMRGDDVLGKAHTTLVFVDAKTKKPIALPEPIKEKLLPFFNKRD